MIEKRPWPERGAGGQPGGLAAARMARLRAEAEGPASTEKRLWPERGAGGQPATGGPPSESERGWGPASTDK